LRKSNFSTPKKDRKVKIIEEDMEMHNQGINSPEYDMQGKFKSGKQTPIHVEGMTPGSGMTLDTTMKVWRISHLIPDLYANEKSIMGSALCDYLCKNPHAK
jgi:hypothetical protein